MSYSDVKNLQSSEKDFACILEQGIIVSLWTLDAGTIYYNDFNVSDSFLEYVVKVTVDGVALTSVVAAPTTNQFYWNWDNKRLYIDIGGAPSTEMIVVVFEIFVSTRIINMRRDPDDPTSPVVYYDPRMLAPTIPKVSQDDPTRFGTESSSMNLINSDGAFYIYDEATIKNKNIKIYQIIDEVDNFVLAFSGKMNDKNINDTALGISYYGVDLIYNQQFNSSFASGLGGVWTWRRPENGFYSFTQYPNLDPFMEGKPIRTIVGKVDSLIPVNLDYSDAPTIANNRIWAVANTYVTLGGFKTWELQYTFLAGTTTTRLYLYDIIGGETGYFVGDRVNVWLNAFAAGYDRNVVAVANTYIDLDVALPGVPVPGTVLASDDKVRRNSICNIKIRDNDGVIYEINRNDYVIQGQGPNGVTIYGFYFINNFEAGHAGLTLFDPSTMGIYCTIYGTQYTSVVSGTPHSWVDENVRYKNLANAGDVLSAFLLQGYLGFSLDEIDTAAFDALTTPLGLSIPENVGDQMPTYREIFNKIGQSLLGKLYVKLDGKISWRSIEPMGASVSTLTDRELLSFGVNYDSFNLSNRIKVLYARKENYLGGGRSYSETSNLTSALASYLHEIENESTIVTYLLDSDDADEIAQHYLYTLEDWLRKYSFKIKTQLMENVPGDIITIERDYLPGNTGSKKMRITGMKKALTGMVVDGDDQKNIEDNSGSW